MEGFIMMHAVVGGYLLKMAVREEADRNNAIADHLRSLRIFEQMQRTGTFTFTHAVDAPNRFYPVIKLEKENKITINLILDIGPGVYKDKFLLCRSILPTVRMNALAMLVDDPNGECALRVAVYNYSKPIYPGSMLAIMHPWFKRANDGGYAIRVENPKHIQVLTGFEPWMADVVWKAPLPLESGVRDEPIDTIDDPALLGNEYFKAKEFAKSAEAYTKAIEKDPKCARFYSNRSQAYLELGDPASALKDAEIGLKLEPTNMKLIFRKGKALLGSKKFDQAVSFFENSARKYDYLAKNKDFSGLMEQAKLMRHEFKTGKYDLVKMLAESKWSKLQGHAEYFATDLLELKQIHGKGRGWVAKKEIKAGTLLMACKAFAYADCVTPVLSINADKKTVDGPRFAPLVQKICDKISNNPELADDFYKLYAGAELGSLESADRANPIDIDRIQNIVRLNAFGADDVFKPLEHQRFFGGGGLWILASYFNHSCVDCNCFRYFVGNFMFVRAKKSIDQGEELLFEYIDAMEPFEERRRCTHDTFGFECACRLCKADRSDSKASRKRFREINGFQFGKSFYDVPAMKNLLQESLKYARDKSINFMAIRVQLALAAACARSNPTYSMQLLKETFEMQMAAGGLYWALLTAKKLAQFPKEAKTWANKAKTLAKFLFGDERAADQIQLG